MTEADLAAALLEARDRRMTTPPPTRQVAGLGLDGAYRVGAALERHLRERGYRRAGWKVGFTNRTVWPRFGIAEPILGPVYEQTVTTAEPTAELSLAGFCAPRIEVEVVFGIGKRRTRRSGVGPDGWRWASKSSTATTAGTSRPRTRWRTSRSMEHWSSASACIAPSLDSRWGSNGSTGSRYGFSGTMNCWRRTWERGAGPSAAGARVRPAVAVELRGPEALLGRARRQHRDHDRACAARRRRVLAGGDARVDLPGLELVLTD